jgi:hypothetical protein
MRSGMPTSQQTALVEELFQVFCERDYPTCLAKVFDLGMTLRLRTFTPILTNGIGGRPDAPDLQIILIHTVACLRVGDQSGAETAFMLNLVDHRPGKDRLMALPALSLRRSSFPDVLKHAPSDQARLQAHYWEAEGRLTDRMYAEAFDSFRSCTPARLSIPEEVFAEARLSWLAFGDLPS